MAAPNCRACGDPGEKRDCCEDHPVFCDDCMSMHQDLAHPKALSPWAKESMAQVARDLLAEGPATDPNRKLAQEMGKLYLEARTAALRGSS